MIKVENLTKSYKINNQYKLIFKNINFTINDGESVALLGKNGVGKSTLLRLLSSVDLPDSGQVIRDSTISWPVGMMGGFQANLTAKENVIFVSILFLGNNRHRIREKINFVREFADIGDYFDKPFKTYSSGMRARVLFALSMAFDHDFYLLDEVSAAGDLGFKEKCRKILLEKHKNSGFIMVDHNLLGLDSLCDKAFILTDKKIIEYEDVNEAILKFKGMLLK